MNQRTGSHSTKSFICAREAGSLGKKSLLCKYEDGRPAFNPLQPQKSPGTATHMPVTSVLEDRQVSKPIANLRSADGGTWF